MRETTETTRHEVEVDTRLAAAFKVRGDRERTLGWKADELRRSVGFKRDYRTDRWTGTVAEALSIARGTVVVDDDWNTRAIATSLADFDAAKLAYEAAAAVVEEISDLYTGWSRFFLVTNTNGHIHSSMSCTTCFHDTEFAWLPGLSGLTEGDAVDEHGEILCSICFPSAPSEWTNGVAKVTLAAREERAAAKVERDAKKAAKLLGTVLRVDPWDYGNGRISTDRIETIAAAKKYLIDAAEEGERIFERGTRNSREDVALVAETLAARLGTTVEAELADAARKAAKRNRNR